MSTDLTVGQAFENRANSLYSLSTYLAVQLVHFRNGPNKSEREMTDVEAWGRKIVGELGFAALVVASVIETLVRIILILPLTAIDLCCIPEENKDAHWCLKKFTWSGAAISGENIFNCFTAAVENFRAEKSLDYDQIMPSISAYNKEMDELLDGMKGAE